MVRAILHVVKRIFCFPFLMHLARQKVQMTFFSRKTLRKEQNNCSFCGESHSSCSQKEQFFCPFLMHLARQKVQMTFFSSKTTLTLNVPEKLQLYGLHVYYVVHICDFGMLRVKKGTKQLLFLWREPFFM